MLTFDNVWNILLSMEQQTAMKQYSFYPCGSHASDPAELRRLAVPASTGSIFFNLIKSTSHSAIVS